MDRWAKAAKGLARLPGRWQLRLTGTTDSPKFHPVYKTLQTRAALNRVAPFRALPVITCWDNSPGLQGRSVLKMSRARTVVSWPCAIFLVAAALTGLCWPDAARAQSTKSKVPVLDKIESGSTEQAFSGIVESIDVHRKILNVNTVTGGAVEIFPIKKSVHVATADGDRLDITEVKPGTNVLIYFDQKGDHRTVKEIVVLKGEATPAKKSPPPS